MSIGSQDTKNGAKKNIIIKSKFFCDIVLESRHFSAKNSIYLNRRYGGKVPWMTIG